MNIIYKKTEKRISVKKKKKVVWRCGEKVTVHIWTVDRRKRQAIDWLEMYVKLAVGQAENSRKHQKTHSWESVTRVGH